MTQPRERTRITRLQEKGSADRAALDALLDRVHVGHFGLTDPDGRPVVIPTAVVRDGDRVLAHGSTGSPWIRALAAGAPTCLAVTSFDGLVVARSAFESSIHYLPRLRRPAERELSATLVFALPIGEWSLKISDGWPDDPPGDVSGGAWAGVVPVMTAYGAPAAAPDLRAGIDVPASVLRLASPVRGPGAP